MSVSVTNLVINQNQDFFVEIQVLDNTNSLLDFTGYTATAQLRKHYSSNKYWNFEITLINPGFIQLSLSNSQTRQMSPGRYVYDIVLKTTSGFKIRVAEGIVTLVGGATR